MVAFYVSIIKFQGLDPLTLTSSLEEIDVWRNFNPFGKYFHNKHTHTHTHTHVYMSSSIIPVDSNSYQCILTYDNVKTDQVIIFVTRFAKTRHNGA